MPERRKCKAYLASDADKKKKRVVVSPGQTMADLMKDLSSRFDGVDIKEITDNEGCVIELVDDIFADDTLCIVPVGFKPAAGQGGGAGGAAGASAAAAPALPGDGRSQSEVVEMQVMTTASATDFDIDHVVAGGQNGMVFATRCTRPGLPRPNKMYATKLVFNFGVTTRTGTTNAFENEYFVLSVLPPHPNVLRFWGTFWDKIPDEAIPHLPLFVREQANYHDHSGQMQRRKTQFIVVDYHPQSLQELLDDLPAPLPYAECLDCVVGLLRAIDHLNKQRVAHLDLKTDNVLVATDGRLVLCDFGSAVQFPSSSMELPFSPGMCPGGNQMHLSPEVLNAYNAAMRGGHGGVVPYAAQEMFALGVLVYECAIRTPPFPDYPNECRGADSVIRYSVDSLPELPAEYPQPFKDLVRSMLEYDPAKRITAGKALAEAEALRAAFKPAPVASAAATGSPSVGSISITVKSASGASMMVTALKSILISELKAMCAKTLLPDVAPDSALLLYAGMVCDNTLTLDQMGLEGESCVHLVPPRAPRPAAPAGKTPSSTDSVGTASKPHQSRRSLSFSSSSRNRQLDLLHDATTVRATTTSWGTVVVNQTPVFSGRHLWLYTVDELVASNRGGMAIGIVEATFDTLNGVLGAHPGSWGYSGCTGDKGDGSGFTHYGESFSNGDVIGVDLDLDAGTLRFTKNGVDQGMAFWQGLKGRAFLSGVCLGGVQAPETYHQVSVTQYVKGHAFGFHPYLKNASLSLSANNLTCSSAEKAWGTVIVNGPAVASGSHNWQFKVDDLDSSNKGGMAIGVVSSTFPVDTGILGAVPGSWAYSGRTGDKGDGKSKFSHYGEPWATGDTVGIHLDMDLGTLSFSKNGKSQGVAFKGVFDNTSVYAAVCIGGIAVPNRAHQLTLMEPPKRQANSRFSTTARHPRIELSGDEGTATGNSKIWGTVLVEGDGISSGKRTWTFHVDRLEASDKGGVAIGVVSQAFDVSNGILGTHEESWAYSGRTGDRGGGSSRSFTSYGEPYKTGDTIAVQLDMDAGSLSFSRNGVSQGVAFSRDWRAAGQVLTAAVCIGGVLRRNGYHRVTLAKVE